MSDSRNGLLQRLSGEDKRYAEAGGPPKPVADPRPKARAEKPSMVQAVLDLLTPNKPADDTSAADWISRMSAPKAKSTFDWDSIMKPGSTPEADDWIRQVTGPVQVPDALKKLSDRNKTADDPSIDINARAKVNQAVFDSTALAERAPVESAMPKRAQKTERLTWDNYDKMTPLQKAAVEFNSMLNKALADDNKSRPIYDTRTLSDKESGAYNNTYKNTLGNSELELGDGTETYYNPNTLSVLEQVGYKSPGATMDDFVKGKMYISTEEITKYLTPGKDGKLADVDGNARGRLVQSVAQGTNALQTQLEKGSKMLATFSQSAEIGRQDTVQRYGGVATVDTENSGVLQNAFAKMYDALLDPKKQALALQSTDKFYATLKTFGAKPDDFQQYIGNRAAGSPKDMATLSEILGLQKRSQT